MNLLWGIIPVSLSLLLFLGILIGGCLRLRSMLRPTTLRGAGDWLLFCSGVWILVTVMSLFPAEISLRLLSRAHYVSTILMLTPLVSVLGAKRPGIRVWNFFVVIPMLGMLNWPLIAERLGSVGTEQLSLEPPALLGAGVVLLMVLGNYFGTLFTIPALLYCSGIAIALTDSSESLPQVAGSVAEIRGLSGCLMGIGLYRGVWNDRRQRHLRSGFDGLWLDFRDWFGILWTRRVMERLNQTAEKEQWCCRLALEGIRWDPDADAAARKATEDKMDQAFRWMLRRFVDEEWIDERLSRIQELPHNVAFSEGTPNEM